MIPILPNLKVLVSGMGFRGFGKALQYPLSSAFRFIVQTRKNLVRCKFLEVPNKIGKFTISGLHYEVNMIAHNYVAVQYHAFVFNAEAETVTDDFAIVLTCEDINPVNNSDCYEMWSFLISDDVTGFHGCALIKDMVLCKIRR